ncbi:MAG TPA: hemerythrin domain-containing protein [Acidimicrobiia bacterium]|jgi:hemerythrin-like domain-containing protein
MATTKKTTRTAAKKARTTTKRAAKKTGTTAKRTAKRVAKSTRSTAKRATNTTRKATTAPRNRSNGHGPARPDALTFLKQEHRDVDEMFERFERAGSGAIRRKEQLRDGIVAALSQHAAIEETVFYPAVRSEVRGADSDVLESLEEHHVVKWLLSELDGMDPAAERFTAKMTVLIENVRHHVREEERDLFPEVRKHLDRERLRELGDALREAKRTAPTRPHPRSPDEPPGNAIVGGAAAVVDRARDTGKRAVRRVRRELPI